MTFGSRPALRLIGPVPVVFVYRFESDQVMPHLPYRTPYFYQPVRKGKLVHSHTTSCGQMLSWPNKISSHCTQAPLMVLTFKLGIVGMYPKKLCFKTHTEMLCTDVWASLFEVRHDSITEGVFPQGI